MERWNNYEGNGSEWKYGIIVKYDKGNGLEFGEMEQ